jgi:hypothetical protein
MSIRGYFAAKHGISHFSKLIILVFQHAAPFSGVYLPCNPTHYQGITLPEIPAQEECNVKNGW